MNTIKRWHIKLARSALSFIACASRVLGAMPHTCTCASMLPDALLLCRVVTVQPTPSATWPATWHADLPWASATAARGIWQRHCVSSTQPCRRSGYRLGTGTVAGQRGGGMCRFHCVHRITYITQSKQCFVCAARVTGTSCSYACKEPGNCGAACLAAHVLLSCPMMSSPRP